MIGLCECLHAAYHLVREDVLDIFMPMIVYGSNRVDAGALLKLFEWSLPVCITSYDDVFFPNIDMTEYYYLLSYSSADAFLLRRKNYKAVLLLKIEECQYLEKHHPQLSCEDLNGGGS